MLNEKDFAAAVALLLEGKISRGFFEFLVYDNSIEDNEILSPSELKVKARIIQGLTKNLDVNSQIQTEA